MQWSPDFIPGQLSRMTSPSTSSSVGLLISLELGVHLVLNTYTLSMGQIVLQRFRDQWWALALLSGPW